MTLFNRRESERNFTGMQNNIFNERDNSFAVKTIRRFSEVRLTMVSNKVAPKLSTKIIQWI